MLFIVLWSCQLYSASEEAKRAIGTARVNHHGSMTPLDLHQLAFAMSWPLVLASKYCCMHFKYEKFGQQA